MVVAAHTKKAVSKKAVTKYFTINHTSLRRTLFGINFPNPVGLAAGFDKDAKLIDELACFGFGFIEIGTLTPKPQPGNDKPRLFRLPSDGGLINRMGFNNDGVNASVERLKKHKSNVIVGGNIGKNKNTLNENAFDGMSLLRCIQCGFHLVLALYISLYHNQISN